MDKWDIARKEREEAETTLKAAQDRIRAIEAIRAIAAPLLERYEDAWNGYDRANDLELVDTDGKPDEAAITALMDAIRANLLNHGITLKGDIAAEIAADWSYMANSDGTGTDHRLVCRPAAIWTSEAYGTICAIEAITYDAY